MLFVISCFILKENYPCRLELSRHCRVRGFNFQNLTHSYSAGIIADRRKQLEEEIEDLMNRDEDAENKDKNGEERDADTSRDDADASPTKDSTNRCVLVYMYLKKTTSLHNYRITIERIVCLVRTWKLVKVNWLDLETCSRALYGVLLKSTCAFLCFLADLNGVWISL